MKKILVFAGSNSKNSINRQLATYTGNQLDGVEIISVDLNDYPLPIYGIDLENEKGIPENVKKFDHIITSCDGIIVSLAEHNGSYTAVFKNLLDWLSRNEPGNFRNKPMFLMSTSPGGRGGLGVITAALDRFPRHAAVITASFSLPSFNDNFKNGELIGEIDRFQSELAKFKDSI